MFCKKKRILMIKTSVYCQPMADVKIGKYNFFIIFKYIDFLTLILFNKLAQNKITI